MKTLKLITLIVLIAFMSTLSGCGTLKNIVGDSGDTIKLSKRIDIRDVAKSILSGGEVVDIDIMARVLHDGTKFTIEQWTVKDKFGQLHLITLENGKIVRIDPVRDDGKNDLGFSTEK